MVNSNGFTKIKNLPQGEVTFFNVLFCFVLTQRKWLCNFFSWFQLLSENFTLSSVKQLNQLYRHSSLTKSIASLSWDGQSLDIENSGDPDREGCCVIQIYLVSVLDSE